MTIPGTTPVLLPPGPYVQVAAASEDHGALPGVTGPGADLGSVAGEFLFQQEGSVALVGLEGVTLWFGSDAGTGDVTNGSGWPARADRHRRLRLRHGARHRHGLHDRRPGDAPA